MHKFRDALRAKARLGFWAVPVILGELALKLFEHRVLGWANQKIDETTGPMLRIVASALKLLKDHPVQAAFDTIAVFALAIIVWAFISSASRSKFPGDLKPSLGFGNIHSGSWQPEGFKAPIVAEVKNTQTASANVARNVTARIRLVHRDGTQFTVTQADWLWEKDTGTTHMDGIRGSVDLEGNESQVFILLMVRGDGRLMAYGAVTRLALLIRGSGKPISIWSRIQQIASMTSLISRSFQTNESYGAETEAIRHSGPAPLLLETGCIINQRIPYPLPQASCCIIMQENE